MQGKKKRPPLHLSVVAIEKRAFGLSSTKVTNFTWVFIWKAFVPISLVNTNKFHYTDFGIDAYHYILYED